MCGPSTLPFGQVGLKIIDTAYLGDRALTAYRRTRDGNGAPAGSGPDVEPGELAGAHGTAFHRLHGEVAARRAGLRTGGHLRGLRTRSRDRRETPRHTLRPGGDNRIRPCRRV